MRGTIGVVATCSAVLLVPLSALHAQRQVAAPVTDPNDRGEPAKQRQR